MAKCHYTNTMQTSTDTSEYLASSSGQALLTESQRQAARRQVAAVLEKVYWEEWTPLQGLARWPVPGGQDDSIDIAFTALAYLEGDEDRQQEDIYWLDAQLSWLSTLQGLLSEGAPLPKSVLDLYRYQTHPNLRTAPAWEEWLLLKPLIASFQFIQRSAAWYSHLKKSWQTKK